MDKEVQINIIAKDVGVQTYIDNDLWIRAQLGKWKNMVEAYEKGIFPLEES
jgi:hypothetical protein